MNTPINFELAKLLNSKGLPGVYTFYKNKKQYDLNHNKYTIADVVMWIYKRYGIWIVSKKVNGLNKWFAQIYRNNSNDLCDTNIVNISPTEAYEAAIEYTLNNLI